VGNYLPSCVLIFVDDHFSAIVGHFPTKAFDDRQAIFIERYGPPHKRLAREFQNGFGAHLTGVVLDWTGIKASVSLDEFANDAEHGAFVISLNSYAARAPANKNTDAVKKAAKEL